MIPEPRLVLPMSALKPLIRAIGIEDYKVLEIHIMDGIISVSP